MLAPLPSIVIFRPCNIRESVMPAMAVRNHSFASMIWLPSHASPASSRVHPPIAPGSMHSKFFHPSFGAKSPGMPSAHGFHTVTSGSESLVILKTGLESWVTVNSIRPPSEVLPGVYTRSVCSVRERSEDCSVNVLASLRLSMYEADLRPWTVVFEMS